MKKLLELVKAMQTQASLYLQPATYVSPRGGVAPHTDREAKDAVFIDDVIFMLDGPEQRAAQAEAEADLRDYDALLGVECDSECQRAFWEAVEDVKSHAGDFRNALSMARDHAEPKGVDSDDPGYWQHQLDVLARILKGLENVSAPGDRKVRAAFEAHVADTFDAEQVSAGQGLRGKPVEPPFGCKPLGEFPDEPFAGVDPAPGKLSGE